MADDKLLKKLRNPKQAKQDEQAQARSAGSRVALLLASVLVVSVLLCTFFVVYTSKYKAENISAALLPEQLEGLVVDETFNPRAFAVKYVTVQEGADRNATVTQSGSTLPVLSRYNYQAMTDKNYEVIGAAPWALLMNISANTEDPEMLRYLFNNEKMIQAFLKRPDVSAVLNNPQQLAELVTDPDVIKTFFNEDAVRAVLGDEKLLSVLASSRFMSHILISKSVKHYRDNVASARQIIDSDEILRMLKKDPNIRREITKNSYLKNIAATLLK